MRIWVKTAATKEYLVEFKGTIPYYGDHKSYPPVQKENGIKCPATISESFPGYWLSYAAQKGTGHLLHPHLH